MKKINKDNPNIARITAIKKEISSHPNIEEHKLENLCKRYSISEEDLTYGFKIRYAYTLEKFVRDLCLHKAMMIFHASPRKEISVVARKFGYEDVTRFNEDFYDKYAITPEEYKSGVIAFRKI